MDKTAVQDQYPAIWGWVGGDTVTTGRLREELVRALVELDSGQPVPGPVVGLSSPELGTLRYSAFLRSRLAREARASAVLDRGDGQTLTVES